MAPDEALNAMAVDHDYAATIVRDELNRLRAALAEREWRTIETAPRDKPVFVTFTNDHGKWRRIKAIYLSAKTHPAGDSIEPENFGEYDDETDEYYAPAGWYEDIYSETGLDYGYVALDEQPTHWQPLPEPPRDEG